MSETKYSFLNGIPIDPDPSMPAGQQRWEIVPLNADLLGKDEFFTGLINWHPIDGYMQGKTAESVVNSSIILAFRRPIQPLKEAGAGSLTLIDGIEQEIKNIRALCFPFEGESAVATEVHHKTGFMLTDVEKLRTLIVKLNVKVGE